MKMLRLRIDLTAFDAKATGTFWRFERDGILHDTVQKYATHLLHEYNIYGVKPLAFLDGTFLPDSESPLILRDGDLLRILPGNVLDTYPSCTDRRDADSFSTTATNGTALITNGDSQVRENGDSTNRQPQEAVPNESVMEPADASRVDVEDTSETTEHIQRKRKRGKRGSRVRSKRVSFDVLSDENGRADSSHQMESTPFRRRTITESIEDTQNGSSAADTRSEAYMTALDATPGVSRLSRTPMKTNTPRKNKKLQAGVGYYLGLLGSGDSSVMAPSSVTSDATPASAHLTPGPSNLEESQPEEGSSLTLSERSMRETSLLSTLVPNLKISCDIGMFNVKTSAVEFHPDVTLEVVENNTKKKCLIVRHVGGPLPSHSTETEFKVDWGMLSSVKKL